MQPSSSHRIHHEFLHRGERASYQIENGWMRVTWGGAVSPQHEVKRTPEILMATMMLVQMREWLKKYPDGVPPGSKAEGE